MWLPGFTGWFLGCSGWLLRHCDLVAKVFLMVAEVLVAGTLLCDC